MHPPSRAGARSAGRRALHTALDRNASAPAARRGVHVIDVAVLYAELEQGGRITQADIARQYRKSAGYVSVLCRLGRALRTVPPEERASFRVRQVTFKAAQAVVSRHHSGEAILAALHQLVEASPGVRRRSTTGGVGAWREPVAIRPDEDHLDPLPLSRAEAAARAADFVYRWDAEAAAQDPEATLASYEAFVRTMTEEVVARIRRAADLAARPLGRTLLTDRGPGETSGEPRDPRAAPAAPLPLDLSLRQLNDRVAATLRAHREKMAAFLDERDARRSARRAGGRATADPVADPSNGPASDDHLAPPRTRRPASARSVPLALPAVAVTPDELATDLED